MELLPTKNTNNVMITNYIILFARVLVDFLPAFQSFSKLVRRHIKHPFTEKMKEKSEVVRHFYFRLWVIIYVEEHKISLEN